MFLLSFEPLSGERSSSPKPVANTGLTDVVLWVRVAAFAYTRSEFPMFLISLVKRSQQQRKTANTVGFAARQVANVLLFVCVKS